MVPNNKPYFLSFSSRAFKLLITIVFMVGLLSAADFLSLLKYTKEMSVTGWLVCLVLFTAQLGIATLRLWVVLIKHAQKLPFFKIFQIQSASLLAGNLLIGNLGSSVARIGLLYRLGIAWPSAVGSVLIDRICVMVGLFLMTAATLPFVPLSLTGLSSQLLSEFNTLLFWGVSLVLLLSLFASSEKIGQLMRKSLDPLYEEMRSYVNRWRVLVIGLGLTVLSQAIFFIAQYYVAWEIGIHLSFFDLVTILPAIALLASLPVSVGGWGVREGAMVFGLLLFDVPFEKSLLLSMIVGVLALLAVLPAGLYCIVSKRKTLFQQVPA